MKGRAIDISGALENGLWGYHELPGLEDVVPQVEITPISSIREHSFFSSKLTLSTISGTYLEAGAHILEGSKRIDEYDVADFIRPAKLVRLPFRDERYLITGEMLEAHAPRVEEGDALLVETGWGRMWNKPGYVRECPNMVKSAVERILGWGVGLLGVDVPCIESAWSADEAGGKGGLLGEIFRRGVLLLAPLVNLERIAKRSGTLVCLPLKVKGVSGAPARAVYFEEG